MGMHVLLQCLKFLAGLAIATSPWLFGYADNGAGVTTHLVIGVGLMAMALWNLARLARRQPLVGTKH